MAMMSFRAFLFQRQGGKCYLMTDPKCVALGGQMRLGGKAKHDYASWEHVIPRAKKRPNERPLLLLACSRCNCAKGAADAPPEHIELARAMALEYRKVWWAALTPRAQRRHLARALLAKEAESDAPPLDMVAHIDIGQLTSAEELASARERRLKQREIEEAYKRRRAALGLDALGNSRQRNKRLAALRRLTAMSLGR